MSYKIAVASSDGKQIDESFGSAKSFMIYEVADGKYNFLEERVYLQEEPGKAAESFDGKCAASGSCGTGESCRSQAAGCGGAGKGSAKVELIADCRCVVCRKIGFHIQKQLERRAVSAFDVSVPVGEALAKIAYYFERMDNHISLRAQKNQQESALD